MTAFPKPRPAALERKDRKAALAAIDHSESQKARKRSGGRCELIEAHPNAWSSRSFSLKRCNRRAVHVHHLLAGIGVRGRGASAKAENKLHLCQHCHADMHAHVLVPDGQQFRRVR